MRFRLHIIMGVAGCGKSTVGQGLAEATGATYLEGDALHPRSNIEKMSRGEPLTDDDRWPWLTEIAEQMRDHSGTVFLGCSALKKVYRDYIRKIAAEPICFIHLTGDKALIAQRMAARSGHFMPLGLLDSQFAALEPPDETEHAITVDISASRDDIQQFILERL